MKIKDRTFRISITRDVIQQKIMELAARMNKELAGTDPVFIAVLNGSFMFASDLVRELDFACTIQFVKVSSYIGTHSTGQVKNLIGLNQSVEARNVVILEDIIDSGLTIDFLLTELSVQRPASLKVCSLLVKPKALKVMLTPAYTGFEVENDFLIGYGLDYDGYGRNLKDIYVAVE